MSEKEVYTLKILEKIIDRRLSLTLGASCLNLTPRHLRRLKKAYLAGGASALISKKRGKTNHRHSAKLKELVLSLIREHYDDYGPTLAAEKLDEHHQIHVSKETIRQWMHEANIRHAVVLQILGKRITQYQAAKFLGLSTHHLSCLVCQSQ